MGPKDLADELCGAVRHCEQNFYYSSADAPAIQGLPPERSNEDVKARLLNGEDFTEGEFDGP
jgi:hypothetical protein